MNLDKLFLPFSLTKDDSVACLVSGGVDSMVLLDLLCRYRVNQPFRLEVLHFNFHLRGDESDRDEQFIRTEGAKRGLPLEVIDAPLKPGSGIQERARDVRRSVSAEMAQKRGWTHLALAHQADDQAETVIMRLMRGAGLKGLRGMEGLTVLPCGALMIRPLLSVSRADIQKYAEENHIFFVFDSSNDHDDYLRNRVRHHVLPNLKETYPDLLHQIKETCLVLSEANRLVEERVAAFLSRAEGAIITKNYFSELQEVRFRILRHVLEKGGYQKQFERKHFDELESILVRNKTFSREYGPAVFSHRKGTFTCNALTNRRGLDSLKHT